MRYIYKYCQMNNYSSSSYYRSNPYKDIGFMPPIAQKNRRSPQTKGEIPQGEQHFEPTMKKHYGYSYSGEIDSENVLSRQDAMSPLEKQAMQKSYFRSLNSKDIEGSTTNTLISKAVKNKLKAQQQLQRRKELEKQQAEQRLINQYEQQYRRKYVQEYRQPAELKQQEKPYNYHNRSKISDIIDKVSNQSGNPNDKRRREIQLLKLAQQRKNYAIVDFPNLINNNSNLHNSSMTNRAISYDKQKQKRQRREQVRNTQIERVNYEYVQPQQTQVQRNVLGIPYQKIQNQSRVNSNNQISYDPQRMQNLNQNNTNNYRQDSPYQHNYTHIYSEQNPKNYNNSKQLYERGKTQAITHEYESIQDRNPVQKSYVKQHNQIEQYKNVNKQKVINKGINSPNYNIKTYAPPINDSSFRRFNPTFLSYEGSPFSFASKNLIGM